MKNRNWIFALAAVFMIPFSTLAERPDPFPAEHEVVEKNEKQHMEEQNRDAMKEHHVYLKMYKEVIKDGVISQRETEQLRTQRDKIKGRKRS